MKVLEHAGDEAVRTGLELLIRLAEHGMHSVAFTVGRSPGVGRVEIWRGEVWHAEASQAVGEAALARLLAEPHAHIDAEPLRVAPTRRTVPPTAPPKGPLSVPPAAVPAPEADRQSRYDALVDVGLDALLARDLPMAWWAFERADTLVPRTKLVAVNLERLRRLGFDAQPEHTTLH